MNFNDVLKQSFLEGFSAANLTTTDIALALLVTGAIGLYIFCIYRIITRKAFYSKSFNISLVALAMITAAIILTIQSSVVISLGMVGALSIVRFRTAVKEPMDLVFLFWSISTGIICGAGLYEVAIITSIIVSLAIFLLELLPAAKAPQLLLVNGEENLKEAEVTAIVKSHTKSCKIKTHSKSKQGLDMVYELRIADGGELVEELSQLENVRSVSLMAHDGEVTY